MLRCVVPRIFNLVVRSLDESFSFQNINYIKPAIQKLHQKGHLWTHPTVFRIHFAACIKIVLNFTMNATLTDSESKTEMFLLLFLKRENCMC
jgi:hypothetical protein